MQKGKLCRSRVLGLDVSDPSETEGVDDAVIQSGSELRQSVSFQNNSSNNNNKTTKILSTAFSTWPYMCVYMCMCVRI